MSSPENPDQPATQPVSPKNYNGVGRSLLTVAALLIFTPVGLLLTWFWVRWPSWIKAAVSFLIFLAFLAEVAVVIVLFVGFIRDTIKNAPNQKTATFSATPLYQIKTSNCQVSTFDPVTADPFYDFVASLGPCDQSYRDNVNAANASWGKNDFPKMKLAAEAATTSATTNYQRGVGHFWIGLYYHNTRDTKTAETELLQSIKLAPKFADSYSALSASYNYEKDFANGRLYGQQCVDLDRLYAYCHVNLGVALLALGQKTEGYAELEEALAMQPSNQNIRDIYNNEKAFYK